jgi:hypothetical protein
MGLACSTVFEFEQRDALEDAVGSHASLQSVQQGVTEFMVSARGCCWITRQPA